MTAMKANREVARQTPPPAQELTKTGNEMFEADAGVGLEGLDRGAVTLPFLGILQALSPQVQRGTPQYIDDAQPGAIFNGVTRELFDKVVVTVLRTTHTYCFWIPRDKGGGFKGEEPASDEMDKRFRDIIPDDKKRRITKEGLEITEHRNFYVQHHRSDGDQPAIISMTKSQLKPARDWGFNLLARSEKVVDPATGKEVPVGISHQWILSSLLRTKGENTWYAWLIKDGGKHIDARVYAGVRGAVEFARSQGIARNLDPSAETDDIPGEM